MMGRKHMKQDRKNEDRKISQAGIPLVFCSVMYKRIQAYS